MYGVRDKNKGGWVISYFEEWKKGKKRRWLSTASEVYIVRRGAIMYKSCYLLSYSLVLPCSPLFSLVRPLFFFFSFTFLFLFHFFFFFFSFSFSFLFPFLFWIQNTPTFENWRWIFFQLKMFLKFFLEIRWIIFL